MNTKNKPLPGPIQHLVDKMEEKKIKVCFGLEAQGRIPTIERMISEYSAVNEINTKGEDLSHSEYLWEKIAKEIGWCKETAMLHYIRHLRVEIKKSEFIHANTVTGITAAIDELRTISDLDDFRNTAGTFFCSKYNIHRGQLNFLLSVVAAERIKDNGTL